MRPVYRVKLVAGMLASCRDFFDEAAEALASEYGPVDYRSIVMPFEYTRHYENEMGRGLIRQFISFERLIYPDILSCVKLKTMELENQLSSSPGRRKVNIDPGYVEGAKLVLATTKNYDHRICLKNGIYGEVTLHYRGDSFMPWEWTYPDYRTKEYIDIFNYIRTIYLRAPG